MKFCSNARPLAVSILALTFAAPTTAGAAPLVFPMRGESLLPNTYISTGGHGDTHAVDFVVRRWDGTGWTQVRAGASAPLDDVEDDVGFGQPLYSPIDGEVIACYESFEDHPKLNVNGCMGCVDGGNHIMIRTLDGENTVTVLHLQQNSIPAGLCTITGEITDHTKPCDEMGMTGVRDQTKMSTPFPQVRRGDHIGNMGHSGNSSAPHTHIQWKPFTLDSNGDYCEGDAEPIEWFEGFRQARTGSAPTGTWLKMEGHELVDGDEMLIWPDPIGWAQDPFAYGHDASNLNVVGNSSTGVAAYKDAGGNLDLRSWSVSNAGVFTDQDLKEEGAVAKVALAGINNGTRDVVAVIQGSNGNLKLIPYDVAGNGVITRLTGKESNGGAVDMVAATPAPSHTGVVVAVRDSADDLLVIDYVADSSNNYTRDPDDFPGDGVDALAIATAVLWDGVVTAEVETGTGELIVRSFSVPSGGGVFPEDDFPAGFDAETVDIDFVRTSAGFGEFFVTSARMTNDTLRVDSWDLDSSGNITHEDEITGGVMGAHASAAMDLNDFLTAAVDTTDHVRLISWQVMDDGQLRRSGTRLGRETGELAVVATGSNYVSLLYTDEDDELNLRVYDRNYDDDI